MFDLWGIDGVSNSRISSIEKGSKKRVDSIQVFRDHCRVEVDRQNVGYVNNSDLCLLEFVPAVELAVEWESQSCVVL